MTPQLWKRNLSWPEWRQMHPDLEDREAEYLYMAELKMFQNYQDEIRNQTISRQVRLVGDLMNLSADISNVLTIGRSKYIDEDNVEYSIPLELITDEGYLLVTDEGDQLVA